MTIMLAVLVHDEYADVNPVAFVKLTPERARYYLYYMDMVRTMHTENASVYCLEIFDHTPDYVEHDDVLFSSLGLPDIPDDHQEGVPYDDSRIPSDQWVYAECSVVSVCGDRIHWNCYLNHTYIKLETVSLPRELIERYAKTPEVMEVDNE